jgi:hypothetical protein
LNYGNDHITQECPFEDRHVAVEVPWSIWAQKKRHAVTGSGFSSTHRRSQLKDSRRQLVPKMRDAILLDDWHVVVKIVDGDEDELAFLKHFDQ